MSRKLSFALIGIVAFGAALGATALAVSLLDDGAEAEVREIRWGNIAVAVPEGSGVVALREFEGPEINPPNGGPVLVLFKGESFPESFLLIDAETGEVLQDTIEAADRAAIDEVLTTLEVKEFDEKAAPWPYGGTPPNVPRERCGKIKYIPPDPASGITSACWINDPGGYALRVTNGRSTLSMRGETGAVVEETTLILPEDEEAFARFNDEC